MIEGFMGAKRFAWAALCVASLFGSSIPGGKTRVLKGAGKAWVPHRLDAEYPHESEPPCQRFEFRRYYPWYRLDAMGSGTPLREVLYIEISCNGWASTAAQSSVKPLDWVEVPWGSEAKEKRLKLTPDPPFETAEGIYILNTLRDKVLIVTLQVPEKRAVIGYRVWKSDASLPDAKRIVQEVARTLTLD